MKTWIGVLAMGMVCVAGSVQGGVTIDWWGGTGGTGEWSNPDNWSDGVPTPTDLARLQFGDSPEVTIAFDSNGAFDILQRNTATLSISANFKTVGVWDLGTSGDGDTSVTQTDGLMVNRTLNIGNDAEADTFDAKYSISGGIARSTTAVTIGKNGILDIQGDGGTIQFNNGGASAVTMGNGTISYTLAATGVTAIDNLASGGSFTIGTGSMLQIDASSYTAGVGEIDLVTRYTAINGTFDESNVSITGLEEGLSGEIMYDTGRMYLNVRLPTGTLISIR